MTPDCDKSAITTKGSFKIPKWKRTKASDVALLTKPVSQCDSILATASN